MVTEKILLAAIAAVVTLITVLTLICVVKYGFRIEIGWLYFHVRADAPKGVSQKELDRHIETKLAAAIETHMAAMESWKDTARQADENVKALIARKLAEIQIPALPEADFPTSQILAVSVRMELLILNSENHYAHAAESVESLRAYLGDRYDRLLQAFAQFSKEPAFVRHSAYLVLSTWWSVVRCALIQTANQKITFAETARGVFLDDFWRKRVELAIQAQSDLIDVLERTPNLKNVVSDHLRTICISEQEIFNENEKGTNDVDQN